MGFDIKASFSRRTVSRYKKRLFSSTGLFMDLKLQTVIQIMVKNKLRLKRIAQSHFYSKSLDVIKN